MISCVPTLKGGLGRPFFVFVFYFLKYPGEASAASSNQIQATSKQIQATSLTTVRLVACQGAHVR